MPNSKNIPGSLDKACTGLFFRILLCGALILVALLFEPTRAYSRLAPIDPRDPYLKKTLILDVKFAFDYDATESNGVRSSNYTFTQGYGITLSGNIIDPRLIVYDSYVNYETTHVSTGFSGSSFGLGFSSTLLRKFRYPITVYEHRSYDDDRISDSFGFRSLLRFRRLPDLTIWKSWNREETPVKTTLDSTHGWELSKDIFIGPTKNTLFYTSTEFENGSKRTALNIQNITRLSRTSRMRNVIVRHESLPSSGGFSRGFGLTSTLESKTSRKFKQKHEYALYMSEAQDISGRRKVDGQQYSGNWNYALSNKLNMGGTVSVSENNADTPSSKSKREALHLNAGVTYRIAKDLSFSLNSSYSRAESNIISGLGNFSGKEDFRASMSVRYSRKIRRASFNSRYSLGYTEHLSIPDRGGGTGISQVLGLGLGGLRYKKIHFNTGASFSRVDNLTGNLWRKSRTFRVSAVPKYWEKYGTANASYKYAARSDWERYRDSLDHRLAFRAASKTFRNTSGSATQSFRIRRIGPKTATTYRTMSTSFSVRHKRRFKGGLLNASGSLNYQSYGTGSSMQKRLIISARTGYKRQLLRRISWGLDSGYHRFKDLDANTVNKSFYFRNLFLYRLRSWYLQATQTRSVTYGDNVDKTTDDRLMVTLSRQFYRIF